VLARRLTSRLEEVRENSVVSGLKPDGKCLAVDYARALSLQISGLECFSTRPARLSLLISMPRKLSNGAGSFTPGPDMKIWQDLQKKSSLTEPSDLSQIIAEFKHRYGLDLREPELLEIFG